MSSTARSHKTAVAGLAGAFCTLAAAACAGPGGAGTRTAAGPGSPGRATARPATAAASQGDAQAEDWGTDWYQPDRAGGGDRAAVSGDGTVWAVVLATFPSDADPQAPQHMITQLRSVTPQLGDLWVHKSDDGSMVLMGRYDGPQSPGAQADLKKVKEIKIRDVPAFPTAMLGRVRLGPRPADLQPFALMSARRRFPNTDPLYTLEVAVWGDFESNALSLEQVHRRAEDYARQLRTQGLEAYFYHDDDKHLSMVTVGLFDRRAIDTRSGLYSPAVDALLERFPAHLVNGETLREPIDGRNAARGTRVQRPMLVMVPK